MAVAARHMSTSNRYRHRKKSASQKSTPHDTASRYRTCNPPTLPSPTLQPFPLQPCSPPAQGWRAGGLQGWRGKGWRVGGLDRGGLEGWRLGKERAGGLEGWYRPAPHRQQQYLAILYRMQSQTTANRSNRGITTMRTLVFCLP